MADRRLHMATDHHMKCDRTLIGYHIFHRNTKYVRTAKGTRDKVADEMRCSCGKTPLNPEYVQSRYKGAKAWEREGVSDEPDD